MTEAGQEWHAVHCADRGHPVLVAEEDMPKAAAGSLFCPVRREAGVCGASLIVGGPALHAYAGPALSKCREFIGELAAWKPPNPKVAAARDELLGRLTAVETYLESQI